MARKADPTIRGRLLASARTEFSVDGLDGARISSITSRAGVSKGAFYLHFKTKEHAFEEVVSDFFGTIYQRMEELDALLESSGALELVQLQEQLLERDVELFEFLWSQRAFARILFDGAGSSRHAHLIDAFTARVQNQIAGLLEIDRRHGRLRPELELATIAAFIAGGFDRYARVLLASEVQPDIRSDLKQLQNFVSMGLLPSELGRTLPHSVSSIPPSGQRPGGHERSNLVGLPRSGEFAAPSQESSHFQEAKSGAKAP